MLELPAYLSMWSPLEMAREGCQPRLLSNTDFCCFYILYIHMVAIHSITAHFCWMIIPSRFSWDESSSISSGLSDGDGDGSENLSSEEFNASSSLNSLPSTPLGSRRNSSVMVSWKTAPKSLWQLLALLFFFLFFFWKRWLELQPRPLLEAFAIFHSVIYFVVCVKCESKATKTHHRHHLCH